MANKIKSPTVKFLLSWLPLFLILILGAYLRLYRIADYMTFLGDEGRDVLVVKRMLIDHKFTLLGPTASVGGFFLGPIYYYFMLPFLWLFRLDPVGPAVMVALFGILTIFLVFKVGQELADRNAGFLAALFYAVSPLVIAYSRSSWNPNLVPFFSLGFIYSLWLVVVKDKWRYLFLTGFVLGIGLQLHYLFTFLIPVAVIYLFLYGREKAKIRYYFLSLLGFLLGAAPFLAFELRHGFSNTQTVVRFIFSSGDTGLRVQQFIPLIQNVTFRLFGRLITYFPDPGTWAIMSGNKQQFFGWLTLVTILLSLTVFFFRLIRERNKSLLLIFLWLFFGIILFGFYKKSIYDYYFGFMFTLPFLLMGLAFSFIFKIKNLAVTVAAICLLGVIFWVNWQGRPFRFTPNRQLEQTKTISRFVLDKTGGQPFNFALITAQNSDHAYRYFFEIWGNPPTTIENIQNDSQRESVTNQLLVICEAPDCKPLGYPLWEVAGFGRAEIEEEWQVSVVKVFKLSHYQGI